jgi:hypothetical protein
LQSAASSWCALAALLALSLPRPASSQSSATFDDDPPLRADQTADEWEQGRYSAERFEARVKLFGTSYGNYFRSPDDEPATQVSSLSIEGRFIFALHRERRIKLYLQAIREEFDDAEILRSPTFALGLRIDGERHRFDFASRYQFDRGLLDIDDDAEPSDIRTHSAAYSVRFAEDWEWKLEGDFREQRFGFSLRERDSELLSGATSIRYRGFGRRFSPEIGIERRSRDAVDPHNDYEEEHAWVKLRFSPLDALTMSLRYRARRRDYRIETPDDSNFGRLDTRGEWSLRADWLVTRRLALNFAATRFATDSTREGKGFTADQFRFGATVRVGPMRGPRPVRAPQPPPSPAAEPARPRAGPVDEQPPATFAPTDEPTSYEPGPPPARQPTAPRAEPLEIDEGAPGPEPPAVAPSLSTEPDRGPEPADDSRPHLVAVYPIPGTDGFTLVILTNGSRRVASFPLRDPQRLVIDLEGLICASACGQSEHSEGPLLSVRSAQFSSDPRPVVRVVLDLRAGTPSPEVIERSDQILVRFGGTVR